MEMLKPRRDLPLARHLLFDMIHESIPAVARRVSAREESEPSRREIGVAFLAVFVLVALFWLLAKAIGF
jgi:membrane-associated protease RseP (regulator of RpoE activity)